MSNDPIALSPEDIAKRLGIHVSTYYRHIHKYVEAGQIESVRIGRAHRILLASFDKWLEQQADLSHLPRRL